MFALVQVEDFDQGELYARLKQSADEKACGNTGAIFSYVTDFKMILSMQAANARMECWITHISNMNYLVRKYQNR